ncbi:MAG: hypothetical protein COT73_11020 [Bdellovibrio sp. CG10_big_fil_rev_8_21_14_0_10_47_8]|nr:MAG: hypothetical protein COT73_11020 [Bdellovibrio sp. CG10_big_fil_rev_8_21_14_0_10_47_8]
MPLHLIFEVDQILPRIPRNHFHNNAANVTIFVETISGIAMLENESTKEEFMFRKGLVGLCILVAGLVIGTVASAQNNSSGNADAPLAPPQQNPVPGDYYDWGRGRDGSGYCYQFTAEGYVLNGGAPVENSLCEAVKPSHPDWGRGRNGYGYCYRFTPSYLVMNQGTPIHNQQCETVRPSYYDWGRGIDGWIYCFQFTPERWVMNEGRSVPNNFCR